VLYSLFNAKGELDRELMHAQVEICLDTGAKGFVILGLASEATKLDEEERRSTMLWAAEDIGGRVPLMVTIGTGTKSERSERIALARDVAADWIILQPPNGEGLSEGDVLTYLAEMAGSCDMGVAVQYAPSYIDSALSVETLVRLAGEIETFTLVKAETGAADTENLLSALEGVALLVGKGGMELPDHLRGGATGVVPAPECLDYLVATTAAFDEGDMEAVDEAYRAALPAITFTTNTLAAVHYYGKRLFALRSGLPIVHDRAEGSVVTPAGARMVRRFAEGLGPLPQRNI